MHFLIAARIRVKKSLFDSRRFVPLLLTVNRESVSCGEDNLYKHEREKRDGWLSRGMGAWLIRGMGG
jgi:hypothetical protein